MNEKSSWRRSLTHPATLISGLALIVAMSGTAVAAAVIDGGDVKSNSLTGKDVKNRSLTKSDFKGSVQGPRGAQACATLAGRYGSRRSRLRSLVWCEALERPGF